jgi:hypothetical protein
VTVFQYVWTEISTLIRFLQGDAPALIACTPADALRLSFLAAELWWAVE